MTEDIVIRRLMADDLRAYKALRDIALERYPEAFTSDAQTDGHRRAEDYLPRFGLDKPDNGHLTLGAFDAGRLTGAIGLERDLRAKVRHVGHVIGMMVHPDAQGRGIGGAMLEALIREAREAARLELLTLTVTDGNAAAMLLYERAGFVRFGLLPRALKLGDTYHDKVHMVKSL